MGMLCLIIIFLLWQCTFSKKTTLSYQKTTAHVLIKGKKRIIAVPNSFYKYQSSNTFFSSSSSFCHHFIFVILLITVPLAKVFSPLYQIMDIESTMPVNKAGFLASLKALPTNSKSKVINAARSIKKIGQDDPRRVIHSLKVGLALTLVSLFYYLRPLYDGLGVTGMWAVLTVVVVFEFTVGKTSYILCSLLH